MGVLDKLFPDLKNNNYAVPKQPSFDTMQKVAIPNYTTQLSYGGSYAKKDTPNIAFIDNNEIARAGADRNQVIAHELQHQLSYLPDQKGQIVRERFASPIDESWWKNAKELGKDARVFYEMLQKNLTNPQVQKRFQELGAVSASRVLDNPKQQPLTELLADISSFETKTGKDLTKDPVLQKYLFNDDTLTKLYKSTTGMSGVVIGDSDYTPYSLEAAKAWNKQPQTVFSSLQSVFDLPPFKDTTKD